MATTTSKCGGANHSSASDALIIGLDCSGFVSRCWYQNTKYGTSNISAISSSLGGATTSTPFNSQLRGDIINKAGSHVRMFVKKNPNGTGLYIEEATGGSLHRVFEASYSRTALYSYIVRRYNGASGLKVSGLDEIIENQNEFNFNVFPNVVENETTIHTEVTNYDVTVFNNVGQIVYSQTNVTGNNTINLSEIKAGMYFVNITKDNTKQMFKIIKQ